jgi:hemerythrin-like domain-containing protein
MEAQRITREVCAMRPTETLVLEHQAIQQMLEILVTAAERFQAGELDDPSIFEKAVDFLRGFADRCHHGKEERHLFAKLVEKGVPKNGGPVGVMLMEHEVGRSHIRGMAEAAEKLRAGDKSAEKKLVEHALAYADPSPTTSRRRTTSSSPSPTGS